MITGGRGRPPVEWTSSVPGAAPAQHCEVSSVTEWLLVGLGVLLTIGTALFVAGEFSLVSVDRHAVERAVEAGDRRAEGVLRAVRALSTQLSAAQVGITLTTLVVGFLVEPSLATLLEPPLRSAGVPPDAARPLAVGVGLFLATVFSMLVGELLPQNLGISAPLATAKVVAGPLRVFSRVVSPLITLLNGSANRLLRAVGVEPQEELSSARTPEELAALVRRSGFSRFPVVEEGLDDVVGVVHLKTAIAVPRERRDQVPVEALMADAVRVPETVRLDPLLAALRQQGLQMAVVVDEYGGTAGVVTLEDVVEEIVGEVSDEHDRTRTGVVRLRDGSYVVPGLLRPDEVRARAGLAVPDGNAFETVGGYVMARLGRVPRVGDEVEIPGAVLRVDRMDGRRVDRLRALPQPEEAP